MIQGTDSKLKYVVRVSILIIFVTIIAGCKREDFSWGEKVSDITYSGNVIFLGENELSLLKDVTAGGLIFSEKKGEIEKITGMSILVLGVSDKTPYGLMRKVEEIHTVGNEVQITTTDALLPDLIKEGTITFQKKLLEKDFKLKSKVEGVIVTGPNKSFDGLAITLDNLEIFKDGAKIVTLNGSIGISPEVGLTIKIKSNKVTGINVATTLNMINEVTVSSNAAFEGEEEITAAEFVHSPIIVDSLVFVPEVKIICGFDGTVSCEVTSGVRQDRTITSGMNYSNSTWTGDPLTHTESFDYIKPIITDNSNLKIFSGPDINLFLCGTPVQAIKATGFYSLQTEKAGTVVWKLVAGSDGSNSVKGGILGLIQDYSADITVQETEIASAK